MEQIQQKEPPKLELEVVEPKPEVKQEMKDPPRVYPECARCYW